MQRFFLAVQLCLALVLAGCASAPSTTGTSPTPAAASPPAQRLAPAVALPTSAKRKLVLVMTGPKAVVDAKDWPDFKREWKDTFAEHARQAGVAFTFSEADPRPNGEDGTIVRVNVSDYRFVGVGARIFFGVMTGNAFIESTVKFSSLKDGTAYGEQQYSTSSSAWGGVFAKVTPQQVDSIAANVFKDFAGAKP